MHLFQPLNRSLKDLENKKRLVNIFVTLGKKMTCTMVYKQAALIGHHIYSGDFRA